MPRDLTVTVVQADLVWEDAAANREAFDRLLDTPGAPADLIVLPETFTTGFSMKAAPLAERMDGPTVAWLRSQAARRKAHVLGSLIVGCDGRFFNRLVWATPEGTLHTYDKRHLLEIYGEAQVYTPGRRLLTVEVAGWKIRPFICFDLRFPAWTRNLGAAYDLGIFIASWPNRRAAHWGALLTARAIENQCWVIGVNRVGKDPNGYVYDGASVILDPEGNRVWQASNRAALHTATLAYDRLQDFRDAFPAWRHTDHDVLRLPDR